VANQLHQIINMKNLIPFFFLLFSQICYAQSPPIQWQKSLGGSLWDVGSSIQQTGDGGYIVAGLTYSNDGDVSGNHGEADYWIVKLNSDGNIQWQKSLGGSAWDEGNVIQQTADGGYIVAGLTESNDGDVSGNHGTADFWIVKLNSDGNIQWQKSLGGSSWDVANAIQQTADGGYIVAGMTESNDGDVSGNHGKADCWIVKLNSDGSIQWQNSMGGSRHDAANSIQQTDDAGYIVAGRSNSIDGDVSGNHGSADYWIVKLNSTGIIQWQKSLGGFGLDVANSIQLTADGGVIIAGYSFSNDGDVSGNHGESDYWIVKLTSTGIIEWQKALGGYRKDASYSTQQTADGGYIVAGQAESYEGDVTGHHGWTDFWIVKLNSVGSFQGGKSLGGSAGEDASSILQTTDGGYIVAGYSYSNNGDVSGNHGESDVWIVKLSPEFVGVDDALNTPSEQLEIYPNPAHQSISLKIASEDPVLKVTIYDLLSREMLRQSIPNDGPLDISSLANGLYLLVANTPSGKIFSGKFLKE